MPLHKGGFFISGSSNGRIAEFDSVDIGPNPVPEANFLLDIIKILVILITIVNIKWGFYDSRRFVSSVFIR